MFFITYFWVCTFILLQILYDERTENQNILLLLKLLTAPLFSILQLYISCLLINYIHTEVNTFIIRK